MIFYGCVIWWVVYDEGNMEGMMLWLVSLGNKELEIFLLGIGFEFVVDLCYYILVLSV